jgi:hypothetical protein
MASAIYNEFKKEIGVIDWATASVKVMLVDSSYALDIDAHSFKNNIDDLGVEVTGDGYTAGGQALANKAITRDDANDWSTFDADDSVWSNSTITARGAVVYYDTGDATTSTLIAYVDFVTDKSSSAGDFIIQWHTDGIYRIG